MLTLTLTNGEVVTGTATEIHAFLAGTNVAPKKAATKKAPKEFTFACVHCGEVTTRHSARATKCEGCSEADAQAFIGSRKEFGRKRAALKALKASGKVAKGTTVKEFEAAGGRL
jgi:hypothetical protein